MAPVKLPEKIKRILEERGYFQLTEEERLNKNKASFGAILRSSKGDPDTEKEDLLVIKGIRGGCH